MSRPAGSSTYQVPSAARAEALAGLPLASVTRRALALVLDFFVAGFLFLGALFGGWWLVSRLGLVTLDHDVNLKLTFYGNWYSVVWLVAYCALATWLGRGQTIGKGLCRIQVVSLAHDHLGVWHSVERALGYGASALEGGFGFFQYFLRDDRRTVHDRIAETIVSARPGKAAPVATPPVPPARMRGRAGQRRHT